ncbi:MAG: biotin/lipoyl-binding protein [Oscillospiraceae bacterium]|nr:biotin/lipoyl-binding protein [Oscillospiraceae bacterium]
MDEQTKSAKRRERIKTFLIIFLVILLLLTFFSNTILNYSLPTVSAQYASYGVITEKIRGTGIVTANQNYEIKADSTRVVSSVYVKVGDEVKTGDKLFVLEAADNQEAIQLAESALQEAELAYQKALLTVAPDYTAQDQEIANARADLQTAINRLNQAKNQPGNSISDAAYQQANAQVRQLSSRMEELNTYLLSVSSGELDSIPAQYLTNLQTAKNVLQNAEKKLETAQSKAESIMILVSSSEQEQTVRALERDAEKAKIAYERAKTDYETAKENQENGILIPEITEPPGNSENSENPGNLSVTISLTDLQRAMEDAEQAMRYANEDVENAKIALKEIQTMETDLQNAKNAVTQAQTELEQAQQNYKSASGNITSLIQNDLNAVKSQMEDAQAIVTSYESQQAGTGGGMTDITSLEEAVSQQQRNLQTLILALSEKKQEDTLTQQVNELELKSQQNAIDKQKNELEKLRKNTGTQTITSKNDGIVSVISCAAGNTVMDGDTLASLTLTNSGYTAQFSVTAEQARKLRAGITAEITNQYYSDITAKLMAIRPDTENPKSDNKLLIFEITGSDVSVGQSLALSISCSSQNYDCVVPSSAIMEDNDGKFVLLLKSRSTPLGNRYYASRCDVDVLAHDEINSAVQGDMNSSDFVITNSEKPLTAGTQVRMEEN